MLVVGGLYIIQVKFTTFSALTEGPDAEINRYLTGMIVARLITVALYFTNMIIMGCMFMQDEEFTMGGQPDPV